MAITLDGTIGITANSFTEALISFFEGTQEDGTKVTVAFGVNNNSWKVKETLDEVMAIVNAE
jgi:hypothetical protein